VAYHIYNDIVLSTPKKKKVQKRKKKTHLHLTLLLAVISSEFHNGV